MELVVTTGAVSRAEFQLNQHPAFLQARCSSCRPTNSVKALKYIHESRPVKQKAKLTVWNVDVTLLYRSISWRKKLMNKSCGSGEIRHTYVFKKAGQKRSIPVHQRPMKQRRRKHVISTDLLNRHYARHMEIYSRWMQKNSLHRYHCCTWRVVIRESIHSLRYRRLCLWQSLTFYMRANSHSHFLIAWHWYRSRKRRKNSRHQLGPLFVHWK